MHLKDEHRESQKPHTVREHTAFGGRKSGEGRNTRGDTHFTCENWTCFQTLYVIFFIRGKRIFIIYAHNPLE